MGGKKVLGEGDHERRSGAPALHQGTVRALNGVGRECGRERVSRVCSLVPVLFSWSELFVARWCSLDSAHMRKSLMLQTLFLTTSSVGCHLTGLSTIT